jgi:uncharacterized membrane protein
MPYEWLPDTPEATRLHLWPYRSLPRRGMVWFLSATIVLIALPLLALIGTLALWGMLPFLLAAIAGIWWALNRSFRDGEVLEDLTVTATEVTLTHHRHKVTQTWAANPHWVRVILYPTSGPVPNYLTLQGGAREVEIGAFLSSDERVKLRDELQAALAAHR